MRLLNLPDEANQVMIKEKLSEGVMRPLCSADEKMIKKVLPKIVKEGWTVRKVERYVADNKKKSSAQIVKANGYRKEEDALVKKYGIMEAVIRGRSVTLKVKTDEELKELIEKLL